MRVLPLSALLCLLLGTVAANGQAWPQAKGKSYTKLSHGRAVAADQYDFDGVRRAYAPAVAGDAFFDSSFYLYGEYGLTDRLTLVGMVPYKQITVEDGAFRYRTGGLGSMMVGARVGLGHLLGLAGTRHAAAANAMLTLPLGYTRNYAPSVGAGQADAQVQLSYGASLWPLPLYAQAGAGYRLRSGWYGLSRGLACQPGRDLNCVADARPEYEDEVFFTAEAGASLGRWALVQVLSQGVYSVRSPTVQTSFSATNPIPTRQQYLKVGGGLTFYPIPSVGLSVQGFATPAGRNTIRSVDLFFGIEYIRR